MAVECREKGWWFSRPKPLFVSNDTSIHPRNATVPLECIIRAPGIMERVELDRGISYFYLNDTIEFSDQSFFGWFIGRGRFYKWRSVSEIDKEYEQLETEILQCPLVGRNVLVYTGTEKPGIHMDLLAEYYRIDEKEVRGEHPRVVTTNAEVAQGLVLEGLRDNLHNGVVYPVKIRMLEGPLEGQEVMMPQTKVAVLGNADDLKILRKVREGWDLTVLSEDELSYLGSRGFNRDILVWVAIHHSVSSELVKYKPRRGISPEKIESIIQAANQAGIDVREPIAISTRGGEISVQLLPRHDE